MTVPETSKKSSAVHSASDMSSKGNDTNKGKGALMQRMCEKFGSRRRTEMNEEFYSRLQLIEQHRVCIEALWEGLQHVIQPDSTMIASGQLVANTTHYDKTISALVKAQNGSMAQPPVTRRFLALAADTYGQLMLRTKKFQQQAVPEMSTLLRYKKEYCDEVKRCRDELERRRVPMDAAKHRVEKAHDMNKLKIAGDEYQALIKDFEDSANRMLAVMDQLPEKKDHHRRALRKIMEAELQYHQSASSILNAGLERCCKVIYDSENK